MRKDTQTMMRRLTICIDIVFCCLVLPLMALIFPVERWYHYFQGYVLAVALWLYGVYFMNRLVAVPFLFEGNRKRVISCALILISAIVTILLAKIQWYDHKPNALDQGITRLFSSVTNHQQAVLSLFVIVESFSFAVGLLTQANRQRQRTMQLEADRNRAEIELYKAQIKPHFMFNTLNSLYGLFLTKDSKALESLEKYISMMRYIHNTSSRELVPLSDEADYIRQYVAIQSLRLNEMTSVNMNIQIENGGLKVPPMLLVTFVENCFKHGISPVEESCIEISLTEKNGSLEFSTANRIFPVKHIGEHFGIENCRKRLMLFYPERHLMEIEDNGAFFYVKLKINLSL